MVTPVENTGPEELSDEEEEKKRMSKGLLLCVCYSASIGGIATLTGTGPNLILVGQMSQYVQTHQPQDLFFLSP